MKTIDPASPSRTDRGFNLEEKLPAEPDSRRNNFDALRLLAAIFVLYGHSFAISPIQNLNDQAPNLVGFGIHSIGIFIFFTISGYFVSESWLRDRSLTRFFSRRALRILPGLWALVILTAFVVGPLLTSASLKGYLVHPDTISYLSTGFLKVKYHLPGVFGSNRIGDSVNGSLWSLPAEVLMYLLVPVLYCFHRWKRAEGWILGLFTVGVIVADSYVHHYLPQLPTQPIFGVLDLYGATKRHFLVDLFQVLHVAPYFWMGACFRYFGWHRYLNLQVSVMILLCLFAFETGTLVNKVGALVMIPAFAYVVLSLGFAPRPLLSPISRMGDISYGVYLYGFLVQQTISMLLPNSAPYTNFALSLPVVLVCGLISWHVIENPFLRFKPRSPISSTRFVVERP